MQLQLRQTKNYTQFKRLAHNRKVNNRQVTNLENSIKKLDLTMFAPIMVKNNYIIDGQHRFEACKNLDLPIWFIELDQLQEKDIVTAIALLNNNAKNWSAEDFLHLYCELGMNEYLTIKEYMRDYEMNSLSVAIYFLSGFNQYKSAINKKFKDGNFEIEMGDLIKAEEIGDFYRAIKREVEKFYPLKKDSKFIASNSFLFAFAELTRKVNFDPKNLLSNLSIEISKGKMPLGTTDSVTGYYYQLADLHNSGLKEAKKVPSILDELPF
jgi:hypothetical protein